MVTTKFKIHDKWNGVYRVKSKSSGHISECFLVKVVQIVGDDDIKNYYFNEEFVVKSEHSNGHISYKRYDLDRKTDFDMVGCIANDYFGKKEFNKWLGDNGFRMWTEKENEMEKVA